MFILNSRIKILCKLYGLLLIVYTACRIIFISFNRADFDESIHQAFTNVMFNGLRFDLSAVLLTNLVFTILYLFPYHLIQNSKVYQSVLKVIFLSINSFFIALNLIDVAYFPFVQKRLQNDALLFATGDKGTEAMGMIPTFLGQNWLLLLLYFVFIWLLFTLYNKIINPISRTKVSISFANIVIIILVLGLNVLGIRGGLQLRPIGVLDASTVAGVTNAPFVLNSTFSVLRTWQKNKITEKKYFKNVDFASCDSPIKVINTISSLSQERVNIVVIMVESLSKQYLSYYGGYGHTPFLDSLMCQSMVFDNAYANARESVQGVPSVLSSLPSWMDESYIFSRYATNKVSSLASVLKKYDYSSSFFHGASSGSMGFYSFTKAVGFEQYFGREDYNNEQHFDGSWGIWDHKFLPFMADRLSKTKEPFISAILTLNTHHPFLVPKEFKVLKPSKKYPILNSLQYMDKSLSQFFDKIKNEDWYERTLFVITADHTGPNITSKRTSLIDYSIPIIFFRPDGSLKGSSDRLMAQIDIMPSILHLLGIKDSIFTFGHDIFDPSCDAKIVNYKMGIYHYTNEIFHLYFDGEKSLALFNWHVDPLLKKNLVNEKKHKVALLAMEDDLKKAIQSYQDAIINNKMSVDAYTK